MRHLPCPLDGISCATRRDGAVEVFRLTGHPKAKRCYAWSFTEGKETRFVTVLEIPPVESAQTAVRAAIASEEKN